MKRKLKIIEALSEIKIYEAYVEGKQLQIRAKFPKNGFWIDVKGRILFSELNLRQFEFRIKTDDN